MITSYIHWINIPTAANDPKQGIYRISLAFLLDFTEQDAKMNPSVRWMNQTVFLSSEMFLEHVFLGLKLMEVIAKNLLTLHVCVD